jgi:hypothetical protein
MNDKIKHEVITWGIFFICMLILVYPMAKLYYATHMSFGVLAILSVITGMLLMFGVEWFTKNILKK